MPAIVLAAANDKLRRLLQNATTVPANSVARPSHGVPKESCERNRPVHHRKDPATMHQRTVCSDPSRRSLTYSAVTILVVLISSPHRAVCRLSTGVAVGPAGCNWGNYTLTECLLEK